MVNPDEMEVEEVVTTESENIDVLSLLHEKISDIEKGVLKKEPRVIQKVVAKLFAVRKLLTGEVLRRLILETGGSDKEIRQWLEVSPEKLEPINQGKKSKSINIPEVEAFIYLLVLIKLLDSGKFKNAVSCSKVLMEKVCSNSRRTMDSISAKAYFYCSQAYEAIGELVTLRNTLISKLRTCTLKSDISGQAVLINCILRNYLTYNLYENADVFVSKVKFPEHADNNEWARYLYYLARIKATRLEYSDAQKNVTLALRKAPESSALGFRQAATKLAICIELLLGDIPDKKIFQTCEMKSSLEPYYRLSQAVRDGNLMHFSEVLETYREKFQRDHTYNLILRLRRNVIKIAIRAIGLSYAKISPAQVAKKLGLDNSEEALYILAKAIRDGVIEASLIQGFLVSRDSGDIYKSLIPTDTYKERIGFCLELHNYSVKSMRYPMKKYESKLGSTSEPEDVTDDYDMFLI